MWFLVIISLHMLGEPNVTGVIQVVKFPDQAACQKTRAAMETDGVFSTCTSNEKDASGFVAAMNCSNKRIQAAPGGINVQVFDCAPHISVPR